MSIAAMQQAADGYHDRYEDQRQLLGLQAGFIGACFGGKKSTVRATRKALYANRTDRRPKRERKAD